MEIVGGLAILAILMASGLLLTAIISTLCMSAGAAMVGLEDATLSRAFVASILSACAAWGISFLLSCIPLVGSLGGWMLGMVCSALIIQNVYDCKFEAALIVWIFHFIAELLAIVAVVAAFLMLGLGAAALGGAAGGY